MKDPSHNPVLVRRLTGSSLDRIDHCPASAVLPAHDLAGTRAARIGTSLHDELENRSEKLAQGLAPHGLTIEDLWPASGLHEVQVWYDPSTRLGGYRVRGVRDHRDYSGLPEAALVGTIDYMHPGLGTVDDLKTGYPPRPDTLQLGLAVVALGDQDGPYEHITASITGIRVNKWSLGKPRREELVHDRDGIERIRCKLDALYAGHLVEQEKYKEHGAGVLSYGPSSWACRYCSAGPGCDRKWRAPDGSEP